MKMSSHNETTTQGYLIALVGVAIWSATAIFIRYLNNAFDMPPMAIAFWRDFFVALTLAIFFLFVKRNLFFLGRDHLGFILGYGLALAIFNSLWTFSVKMNGAAISTVLVYSSAAFTALYERWFLKNRLGWRKILAISLSLFGCVLVSGVYDSSIWQLNPWGVVVGLLSGVGFTAYSLLGKRAVSNGINSWTALMYTFAVASLFLLAINFLPDLASGFPTGKRLFWLGDSLWGWTVLILLAMGPSIGGYGLYTFSLSYLSASVANLIATLEPSMTALLAYLLLGERYTPVEIMGSILILAGVVILRLREWGSGVGQ
jgi:drug/metabolite transporter (DMT)-like permease